MLRENQPLIDATGVADGRAANCAAGPLTMIRQFEKANCAVDREFAAEFAPVGADVRNDYIPQSSRLRRRPTARPSLGGGQAVTRNR